MFVARVTVEPFKVLKSFEKWDLSEVQCIEPVKRQDLSVETLPRNASFSCPPPGSLHHLAQAAAS